MGRSDGPTARPALRRPTVVAAARELVVESGVDSLSLRNLAGRLGVSAPALYAHIATKGELLAAVAAVELDGLAARFAAAAADAPRRDAARAMAAAYVEYAFEEPGLFGLLDTAAPTLRRSDAFASLEAAAGAAGAPDPPTMAAAVWAAAHGAVVVARLSGGEVEDARALLAVLLGPLLTREPRAGP